VLTGTVSQVSHFLASATHCASSTCSSGNSILHLEIFLVLIGLFLGRLWGRRTGLKHLGQTEFNARWANVRRHRRWQRGRGQRYCERRVTR
jgi:hypothetical protein